MSVELPDVINLGIGILYIRVRNSSVVLSNVADAQYRIDTLARDNDKRQRRFNHRPAPGYYQ